MRYNPTMLGPLTPSRGLSIFLIVISSFAVNAFAQSPVKDPSESKQVREFARRFYHQYRETNSVEPLLADYFDPNMIGCLALMADDDKDAAKLELSEQDMKRAFIVAMDYWYFESLAKSAGRKKDKSTTHHPNSFSNIFDDDLAERLRTAEPAWSSMEGDTRQVDVLNNIGQLEQLLKEARDYLNTHKLFVEKDTDADYGAETVSDESDDLPKPCMSLMAGAKAYLIGTPLPMIQLLVVKRGETVRILVAAPLID